MTDRDNITLPREVVHNALDALEGADDLSPNGTPLYTQEREALRAHLAAPKQEPLAYFDPQKREFYWARPTQIDAPTTVAVEPLPLYTAPPALAAPNEDIEALRRDAERWKDLATDAVSGLSYIRQYYGQLAGVGWDRVFAKKAAIDAAMGEKT